MNGCAWLHRDSIKNYVEVAVFDILGNEWEVFLSELILLSVVTDLVVS